VDAHVLVALRRVRMKFLLIIQSEFGFEFNSNSDPIIEIYMIVGLVSDKLKRFFLIYLNLISILFSFSKRTKKKKIVF
jgi:hypothetical protein